jgi:hypothetical protein
MWWFHTLFGRMFLWQVEKLFQLFVHIGMKSREGTSNYSARPSKRELTVQRSQEVENRRMAGCREVVMQYLEAAGYIAREAITRAELEQLIDKGIEPDALAREIQRRIDAIPGVMLGHMQPPNGHIAMKLPDSLIHTAGDLASFP